MTSFNCPIPARIFYRDSKIGLAEILSTVTGAAGSFNRYFVNSLVIFNFTDTLTKKLTLLQV